jgi:hypothetical protein
MFLQKSAFMCGSYHLISIFKARQQKVLCLLIHNFIITHEYIQKPLAIVLIEFATFLQVLAMIEKLSILIINNKKKKFIKISAFMYQKLLTKLLFQRVH